MIAKRNERLDFLVWSPGLLLCAWVLLRRVICNMLTWEMEPTFYALQQLFTTLLFGVVLAAHARAERKSPLLFIYYFWLLIVQLMQEQWTFFTGELFAAAVMCLAYYLPLVLDEKKRMLLLRFFCVGLFCILFVWAVLGLRVVLTNGQEIPLLEKTIRIEREVQATGILRTVAFCDNHRNTSSAWFLAALWLAIAGMFRTKKGTVRAALAAFALLMHLAIALQHCRSVQVVSSAGLGLLAILLIRERLPVRRPGFRVLCMGAIFAAVLLCTYKSFSFCSELTVDLSQRYAVDAVEVLPAEADAVPAEAEDTAELPPVQEAESAEMELPPVQEAEGAEDGTVLSDRRNFFRDLLTLTARTEIWAAEIRMIWNKPMTLLYGIPEGQIFEQFKNYGGLDLYQIYHAHNTVLQLLLIGGLPGTVILCLFLLRLLKNLVCCFLGDIPMEEKVIIIFLMGLMVVGILEPMFSLHTDFSSVIFLLLAGTLEAKYEWRHQIRL